jgi:DNA primase
MDKNQILSVISPAQIYTKFLNLQEFPAGNIHSPFSADKNPSLKLYKNGTFKCFSSGKQGDVFQFVADLKNLDCKRDFKAVTDLIAAELNLSPPPEQATLKVANQPMTPAHFKFWSDLGVTSSTQLEQYNVRAVKSYEYFSTKKNKPEKITIYSGVLAFSYEVNGRYEIYIPAQPDKKIKKMFFSGLKNEDIFGLDQITTPVEKVVICAGKKDCLCLVARNIPAVTFRSEAIFPRAEDINKIRAKAKQLFICYDNDFDNPQNPGRTQMLKIAKQYNLIPVLLPDKINDIADFFAVKDLTAFSDLLTASAEAIKQQKEAETDTKATIFHTAEKYLSAFYDFRFNTVKLDIEISPKNQSNFTSVNENTLYIEMQKKGINISMDKLLAVLKSDYVPKFDPFAHYFQSLPAHDARRDGDVIARLAGFVSAINQKEFEYHFRKWLVRTVKCAMQPNYFNKQAFILVHSQQNSGKSTFCRFLCLASLSDYIAEDISNDKDARILLCKNFLINLDELAVLSKQEINSLKSYFSKTQINERLPYDRKNSIINRTCSFIGSTNMDEFLSDETGSVRWLCFRITSINWNYSTQIDINRLWAQAYALAQDKAFECELTREDIAANEERNRDFQILSREKALIHKYFKTPEHELESKFMTATDIDLHLRKETLDHKLTTVGIGKAMRSLGYERVKQDGIYGYFVSFRPQVF